MLGNLLMGLVLATIHFLQGPDGEAIVAEFEREWEEQMLAAAGGEQAPVQAQRSPLQAPTQPQPQYRRRGKEPSTVGMQDGT